jgi:hypothetical protein
MGHGKFFARSMRGISVNGLPAVEGTQVPELPIEGGVIY